MKDNLKPDLSEHEEEVAPFDDVMRKLLGAKPVPKLIASKTLEPKEAETRDD